MTKNTMLSFEVTGKTKKPGSDRTESVPLGEYEGWTAKQAVREAYRDESNLDYGSYVTREVGNHINVTSFDVHNDGLEENDTPHHDYQFINPNLPTSKEEEDVGSDKGEVNGVEGPVDRIFRIAYNILR